LLGNGQLLNQLLKELIKSIELKLNKMKAINKLFLFCICVSIIAGCSKITEDKKENIQGKYEVDIEGYYNEHLIMQGSCTNVFANYSDFSDQGLPNTKSLTIQGLDDQFRLVSILLYFSSLPLDGIFHLGLDDESALYSGIADYNPDASNISSVHFSTDEHSTGTCKITNYNKASQTISGTFSFSGQGFNRGGGMLAGVTSHFNGTFDDVPINDITDPNNPKGVCFGTIGSPLATGGSNGGGGGGGGGNGQSTITFINPAFTPIDITFNGENKTAPIGGKAVFSGPQNTIKTGNASTSGKTSQGTQVGLFLSWDFSISFPVSGSNIDYTLDVSSDYFFLKMINNSSFSITQVYVNYGLQSQTFDNITIQNNGSTYSLGYYKAFTNSNVRAEDGQHIWSWNQLNLHFTKNQAITVQAVNGREGQLIYSVIENANILPLDNQFRQN
jgi:hypothetical protein